MYKLWLAHSRFLPRVFTLLFLLGMVKGITAQPTAFQQGFKAYRAGNYTKAVALYSRYLAKDSTAVNGYYNRGLAYEQLGQVDHAYRDYRKAWELDTTDVEALYRMGLQQQIRCVYPAADTAFRKVIAKDSSYLPAYMSLAEMALEAADWDQAIQWFNQVEPFDSSMQSLYEKRAFAFEQLDRNEEALNDWLKLLALDPSAKNIAHVAHHYFILGEYTIAKTYYKQAYNGKPSQLGYLLNQSISAFQAGTFQEASDGFLCLIEQNAYLAHAHWYLGLIAAEQNNYNEAIRYYRATKAIDPDYPHLSSVDINRWSLQARMQQPSAAEEGVKRESVAIDITSLMKNLALLFVLFILGYWAYLRFIKKA